MPLTSAITTMVGAALFPLMIRLVWGRFVDDIGPLGGLLAAGFIVGLMWLVNHGIPSGGLIFQTGAWVDMGLAAGVGCLTADLLTSDHKFAGALPKILAAILGGLLAGLVLSFAL